MLQSGTLKEVRMWGWTFRKRGKVQGRSGMEGMGLGWNQETSRRWLGEEDDPVGEGRVVGRGWGGQGSGKGADP